MGTTIVTSQTIWEGIWMSCVAESTGQIECKPNDSLLALSPDLQAARVLSVLAIATGSSGLLLAFVGWKYTRFLDKQAGGVKGQVAIAAGTVWSAPPAGLRRARQQPSSAVDRQQRPSPMARPPPGTTEARQRLQSQPRGVGKTRPPWEEDEGLAVLEQDYRLGSEGVKNCLQSFS